MPGPRDRNPQGRAENARPRDGLGRPLPHGSVGYQTIFAAGLALMLLTLGFNLIGHWMRRRFREVY